jgi:hypothetical protein
MREEVLLVERRHDFWEVGSGALNLLHEEPEWSEGNDAASTQLTVGKSLQLPGKSSLITS